MTLEEMQALEAKATPAPWSTDRSMFEPDDPHSLSFFAKRDESSQWYVGTWSEGDPSGAPVDGANSRLVSALRNVAPELLALAVSANAMEEGAPHIKAWTAIQERFLSDVRALRKKLEKIK